MTPAALHKQSPRHRALRQWALMTVLLCHVTACVAPQREIMVTADASGRQTVAPVQIGLQVDGDDQVDWRDGPTATYQVPTEKGYLVTAVTPGYTPQQVRYSPMRTAVSDLAPILFISGLIVGFGAAMGWLVDTLIVPRSRGVGVTTGLWMTVPVVLAGWATIPWFLVNPKSTVHLTMVPDPDLPADADSLVAPGH